MERISLIHLSAWLQRGLLLAFPRLGSWPVADWPKLLKDSSNAEPDFIERAGLILCLIATAVILEPDESSPSGFMAILLGQFLSAIPMLLALFFPFYVRRIRISLDAFHQDAEKSRPLK